MHNPFFSIIIPTYNRAHLIERTLESIRAQDFSDYEVVIVDDGSTDNTEEVIKQYIDLHQIADQWRYFKKENAERAAARNFGTHQSSGKYINWFDSDDLMCEDNLSSVHRFLMENSSVCFVAVGYTCRDHLNKILDRSNYSPDMNRKMLNGNFVACSPVFVEKHVAKNNPFNENRHLSGSEDYELWMRLAAMFRMYCITSPSVIIVQHESRSVITMTDENTLINRFQTFINLIKNNDPVVKFLGKNYRYFIMKNYLLLAVELAVNKHKKASLKYLKCAFQNSVMVFSQRTFYATLKHLLMK